MAESVSVQLRLRRAFRYVYFAFLAIAVASLTLLGLWAVSGDAASSLFSMIPDRAVVTMIALAVGFSVPLFFLTWLVVSSAMLGHDSRRRFTDGLRD